MEYGKKLQDTQTIDAIVEEIAFYMYDYATSDTSISDIHEYMEKMPEHITSSLDAHLPYIKTNKSRLFQRSKKLHYDDDVCDMMIDEMAKYFGVQLENA